MTTPAWLVWTKDDTGLAKVFTLQLAKVFAYIWPPGLDWRWPNLAKESILQLANVFAYIWVWPPKLGCKIFTLQLGKVFAQHMTTPAWLVWTRDDTGLARTILSVSLCLASAMCPCASALCTVHCVWPVHCLHIIVALYHVCRCQHKMQLVKYNFPLLTCSAKAWCKVQTFVCRSLRACSANW